MGQSVSAACLAECRGVGRSDAQELTADPTAQEDQRGPAPKTAGQQGTTSGLAGQDAENLPAQLCSEGAAFGHLPAALPLLLGNRAITRAAGESPKARPKDGRRLDAFTLGMLRRVFDECDRDGDGSVSKRELVKACQGNPDVASFFGLASAVRHDDGSLAEVYSFFQGLDNNEDHEVSFQELLAWYCNKIGVVHEASPRVSSPRRAPSEPALLQGEVDLFEPEALPTLLGSGALAQGGVVVGLDDKGPASPPPAQAAAPRGPSQDSGEPPLAPPEPELEADPQQQPAEESPDQDRLPAEEDDPSRPGYVPGTLRHGPRELRHMRHLGLAAGPRATELAAAASPRPAPAAPGSAAAAASPAGVSPHGGAGALADDSEDEAPAEPAESKAQKKAAKKAQKKIAKHEAKIQVRPFLDLHGFTDVKTPKRTMFKTMYPLHAAVRQNDLETVRLLTAAGACPTKADSWGRTPLELARKFNNRAGSHVPIILLLQRAEERKERRRARHLQKAVAVDVAKSMTVSSDEEGGAGPKVSPSLRPEDEGAGAHSSTAASSSDPAPRSPTRPAVPAGR